MAEIGPLSQVIVDLGLPQLVEEAYDRESIVFAFVGVFVFLLIGITIFGKFAAEQDRV